ncbi:MAG: zinc ribbon domain-containing protein [Ruminococcus sp.]|nr:zinc ribbon domain-containing protein [Ruminococcus sp.]
MRNSFLQKKTNTAVYPFTGKIQCGCCDKNYRRKTTTTGIVWICATYNTKGKKYCPTAKQIPENTLISVCCEVLEISEWDEDIFEQKIERILIPAPNELTFVFRDGHEISEQWKDRSRSESWTDEMRKATGERSKKWHEKSR